MNKNNIAVVFLMFVLSIQGSLAAGDSTPEWVPEGYKSVYAQDFFHPNSINDFVFSTPADWKRVRDGAYYALEQNKEGEEYDPPVVSPRNVGLINHLQFGSFALEYYVQQSGRKYPHRDACVFFNVEDPSNYYYVHIGAARDPRAYQIFNVDDKPRTPITRDQEGEIGHNWKQMKWHRVRLIRNAHDGTITFYINNMNEPAMVATDRSHTSGYIGFGSFDDQIRVRNIRIWAPEVKQKPADFFQSK